MSQTSIYIGVCHIVNHGKGKMDALQHLRIQCGIPSNMVSEVPQESLGWEGGARPKSPAKKEGKGVGCDNREYGDIARPRPCVYQGEAYGFSALDCPATQRLHKPNTQGEVSEPQEQAAKPMDS